MIPALVLDVLAVHRLTRLVTADTILVGPRDAIVKAAYRRRDGHTFQLQAPEPGDWAELAMTEDAAAPKVATLVTCRWCTGVYVAAVVLAARELAPRQWRPIRDGLAIASAATLVAGLERD